MTIKTFTTTLLLAASFLLLTACNSKSDTETNTTAEQNPTTETTATKDGSDDNTTTGGTDDNTSTTPTVTPASLMLTIEKTSLNKDENTTVKVMATYSDGTSKEVTDKVEWIVTPKESVSISNSALKALRDTKTSIQAKLDTKLSEKVNLNITWIVDGHTLPPEPDPAINDATLGGVDSNSNGVRDDVERNIYAKYTVPIERAILLDRARFYQKTMIEPVENAKEIVKFSIKIGNCFLHLKHIGHRASEWRENREYIKNLSFNNAQRIRKYLDYNIALSGGTYGSSPRDWNKEACSDEVSGVLEEMGL